MTREQLEHLIRAACSIADDDEVVIIGSQAILGQFPHAPPELVVSMEADLFPKNRPERWDLIAGAIGELSMFHETYGYYADGVEATTAALPAGWDTRLIEIRGSNTSGFTGWALEIHDLLVSKCVANRDKDRRFVDAALSHGLADRDRLIERLDQTPLDESVREQIRARLRV